ncbi:hypothetical protein [uncultured Roseobacter sp.]|uniref:hypothetical protein n=1 Tax=uncultured Roseobacter sp. TaxID=114847 RepID=UPI002628AC64|nr:hypothetical protein [uncultured Roseobacter sp.]
MGEKTPSFDYRDPVPDDLVCVFFEDTAYWHNSDIEEASLRLRKAIEAEFAVEVAEVDIGPGFSVPAWLLEIDVKSLVAGGAVVTVFFQGKNILQNIEAWLMISAKLKSFLHRKAKLNRTAAAALAINEILRVRDKPTSNVTLVEYSTFDSRYDSFVDARPASEGPRIEYQAFQIHVFEFDVDGESFTAVVDGRDVGLKHSSLEGADALDD